MGNVNLGSDESELFRTPRIIVRGVLHEAILTSKRLITVEIETGTIDNDIPLADIRLAVPGANTLREPTLALQISSAGQEARTLDIIFLYQTGDLQTQERDRFLAKLRSLNVPVDGGHHADAASGSILNAGTRPKELVVEGSAEPRKAPELLISSIPRMNKAAAKDEGKKEKPKKRSPLFVIGTFALAVIIIIGCVLLLGIVLTSNAPANQQNLTNIKSSAVPPLTPAPTAPVAATPQPQTPVSPGGTPVSPGTPVYQTPTTGLWVQVQYSGNFTGYIKKGGRVIPVAGTGTKYYQLPAGNMSIEGSVTKQDGLADPLIVRVYDAGTLRAQRFTKVPWGVMDFQVFGQETILPIDTPTPVPTTAVAVEPLPEISIPGGIWVRVYYPGEYVGSAGANGIITAIKDTGDKMYRMPDTAKSIDGSIEKKDGSSGRVVVQVYKDGKLVSEQETRKPEGIIDLHVVLPET